MHNREHETMTGEEGGRGEKKLQTEDKAAQLWHNS